MYLRIYVLWKISNVFFYAIGMSGFKDMLFVFWIYFVSLYVLYMFSVTSFKSSPGPTNTIFWAILTNKLLDATAIVCISFWFFRFKVVGDGICSFESNMDINVLKMFVIFLICFLMYVKVEYFCFVGHITLFCY
jgi:hypothetical protein